MTWETCQLLSRNKRSKQPVIKVVKARPARVKEHPRGDEDRGAAQVRYLPSLCV